MFKKLVKSALAFILFFSILSPPLAKKAHAYSSSLLLTIIPEKLQSTNMIEEGHQDTVRGENFTYNRGEYIRNYIATKTVDFDAPQESKPYIQMRFFNAVQDANGNLYDLRVRVTVQKATASNMHYFYWYKTSRTDVYGPFSHLRNVEVPTAQATVWANNAEHETTGTRNYQLMSSFDLDVLDSSGRHPNGKYSLYFGDIDMSSNNPFRSTKEALWFSRGFSNVSIGSALSTQNATGLGSWIEPSSNSTSDANIGDASASVTADANSTASFWWKGSSCGTCILSFSNDSYVKVFKTDTDTGSSISERGGHFQFLDSTGRVVAERDIVRGQAEVSLPKGLYTLVETSAPEGYQLSSERKVIRLTDAYHAVRFENKKKPRAKFVSIRIKKLDDYLGSNRVKFPLAGAQFSIHSTLKGTTQNLTTDSAGYTPHISFDDKDTLTITETKAPKGHIKMSDPLVISGSKLYEGAIVQVFNPIVPEKPVFKLTIKKVLEKGNLDLPPLRPEELEFTLKRWNSTARNTIQAIIESAPQSTVVFTNANENDPSVIDFSNPSSIVQGKALEEDGKVVFADGIYELIETKINPFYNAESSGQFLKNSLVAGKNVFEVKDGEISDISLKNSNNQIHNSPKPRSGSIVLSKKDARGNNLQGVAFNLYDSENSRNPLATARSNLNGIVRFDGLDFKDYWIEEIKTNAGHSLLSRRIKLSSYKVIPYNQADQQENKSLIQNPKTYNDAQDQKYYAPSNMLSITNDPTFTLPNTGNLWLVALSCIIIAGLTGGAVLLLRKRSYL